MTRAASRTACRIPRTILPAAAARRIAGAWRTLAARAPARGLRLLTAAGVLALAGAGAGPAMARDAGGGTFDLYIRGLRAATLQFAGEETDRRYQATAALRSAGIAAMIKSISFDVATQGAMRRGRPVAERYRETADLGSRRSAAEVVWKGGTPEVIRSEPPREPRLRDIDPATQQGTVDPLTAIFMGLRDQPRAGICRFESYLFDGRRRSRVQLSGVAKTEGDRVICQGSYERVAGFSEREMAEKTRFGFDLTYAPGPEGLMRAVEVGMDTVFGRARLVRR